MCGEGFEEETCADGEREREREREMHKTETNPWLLDSPQLLLECL